MPLIAQTTVTLRFFGDDLDPDELSACLGGVPRYAARKGDVVVSGRTGEALSDRKTGQKRIEKTGKWLFSVADREPGDLDGQIGELFGALTSDERIWRDMSARYAPDLFVGLFMEDVNEGAEMSSGTLALLAARHVMLVFDVYGVS